MDAQRLHLIGMRGKGELAVALATPQSLLAPSQQPSSTVGIWTGGHFTAWSSTVDSASDGTLSATPAPLAGSFSPDGRWATWVEQLVIDGRPPQPNTMAWRLLAGAIDRHGDPIGAAHVLASSHQLTGHVLVPSPTPWHAPAVDDRYVYFEATVPVADSEWEQQILRVPLPSPTSEATSPPERVAAGRLPIATGGTIAWVEDTTANGLDADNDRFTIRFADPSRPAFSIDTGDFYKVQRIAGDDAHLVVAIQDTCSARLWIGVGSPDGTFSHWIPDVSDQVVLNMSDGILLWGNGSGMTETPMRALDLTTMTTWELGITPGYSMPFLGADKIVAIPHFPEETAGDPRVMWTLHHLIDR